MDTTTKTPGILSEIGSIFSKRMKANPDSFGSKIASKIAGAYNTSPADLVGGIVDIGKAVVSTTKEVAHNATHKSLADGVNAVKTVFTGTPEDQAKEGFMKAMTDFGEAQWKELQAKNKTAVTV